MTDVETDKRLKAIEEHIGLHKGITEPPTEEVRASLVGPFIKKPEEGKRLEDEERLVDDEALQRRIQDAIEAYSGSGEMQSDVYEILNEYITNEFNFPRQVIQVRKAYCKTAAGAAATIVCYLNVPTGTEVTVNCKIAGGGNLNAASPALTEGLEISVWNNGGTWKCTTLFQAREDCDCYTAP